MNRLSPSNGSSVPETGGEKNVTGASFGNSLVPSATSFDPAGLFEYSRDFFERSVLFWDTLRQRADNFLEHERRGLPALLDFKWELLLDARTFERPVNYALLRITEAFGCCVADSVANSKPPVIVIDPRAGHGPGIGGFKQDSEVGIALREGYQVYFVIFYPSPCRGQTLADVLHALRRFVQAVAVRHQGRPPILYGNCQGGWAVAILSADCQGLAGPAVLNGSPLSYWSGESGINPARLAGGLLGGVWLARFLSEIGDGEFDGAWLAQNFEMLRPGYAIWGKYHDLFSKIDSERGRFLDFERWWSGFHSLTGNEIVDIVKNLFIGDRLENGLFRVCDCCSADLRRIKNPLVIFASYGDNITPPHQALGWIPRVYADTKELVSAGQRIVYLLNSQVGHLGIFVSAAVAQHEHRAILESLEKIEALPPGLFEMKIDPSRSLGGRQTELRVRFEAREVSDIKFTPPSDAFERVEALSETLDLLYSVFVSPWVKSLANPIAAEFLRWAHPMRASRYLLSGQFSSWIGGFAYLAKDIEKNRHPVSQTSFWGECEKVASDQISLAFDVVQSCRDSTQEIIFASLYDGLFTSTTQKSPRDNFDRAKHCASADRKTEDDAHSSTIGASSQPSHTDVRQC